MRPPFIDAEGALREGLRAAGEIAPTALQAELPSYLESFLAHLRLLVGVPFEHLVPDPRLLPQESIRFFYLDRSYTDRLVDGAVAVGKAGSREQAHHQHHDPILRARLDRTERVVRVLQRGLQPLVDAVADAPATPATVVTGFVLRSVAVRQWPDMEVRAFDVPVADDAPAATLAQHALRVLRLERVAPSVLLALFEGVPGLVWLEEPLHAVPVAVVPSPTGPRLFGRPNIAVPFRAAGRRVLDIATLRRSLLAADSALPRDAGSGVLAEALLGRAYRQRFEGLAVAPPADGFAPATAVAMRGADPEVIARLREVLR
jgi:hypothetical protein